MSSEGVAADDRALDALQSVAAALREAADQRGAAGRGVGGRDMASDGVLGRMTYQTCYGLAYGVVYPLALLARAVPKDNALVHGLVDGAAAARDEAPGAGWASSTSGITAGEAASVVQPS